MQISQKARTTAAVCFAFWFAAQINITPGYFLSSYIDRYGLKGAGQGWISAVYTLGTMVCFLVLMVFFNHTNQRKLLAAAVLLLTALCPLLAQATTFPFVILCYFLAGVGFGIINTTTSALIAQTYPPRRVPGAMGLLHGVFGLGGLCAPMLFAAAEEIGFVWNNIYYIIGALGIACLIVYRALVRNIDSVFENHPSFAGSYKAGISKTAIVAFIRQPGVAQMLLCSLCYGAHQEAIILWIRRYMQFAFGTPLLAGATLSLFWVGTAIARIAVCRIPIQPMALIQIGNFLVSILLISGLLCMNAAIMAVCIFLAGLLGGATHPLLLALAAEQDQGGKVISSGSILAAAYVGHFSLPMITGIGVSYAGIGISVVIAAFAALGSSLFARQPARVS